MRCDHYFYRRIQKLCATINRTNLSHVDAEINEGFIESSDWLVLAENRLSGRIEINLARC